MPRACVLVQGRSGVVATRPLFLCASSSSAWSRPGEVEECAQGDSAGTRQSPGRSPGRPESEAHLLLLRLPTHLAFTSYSKSFILFSACLLTGSFKSLGEEDHAYLVHLIHCVYVFTRRAQAGSAGRRSVGLAGGPRFLNADQRPVQ